jgi:hypothetical protein
VSTEVFFLKFRFQFVFQVIAQIILMQTLNQVRQYRDRRKNFTSHLNISSENLNIGE